MEKEFVPYEESLALKELGFNESCLGWYGVNSKTSKLTLYGFWDVDVEEGGLIIYPVEGSVCIAPLWHQAFRWFREKHGLDHCVFRKDKDLGDFYGGYISRGRGIIPKSFGSNYETYGEAELACLRKLIEIVEENGKNQRLCD
jgi:hypothetical protein